MNHTLHIAAVTQLRHAHSPGHAFYDRKHDEGHTSKSAIRALKRRLSNTAYRHLVADAATRQDRKLKRVREGTQGTTLELQRGRHDP